MFGARPYLEREFDMIATEAKAVLVYWMESFAIRHRAVTPPEPEAWCVDCHQVRVVDPFVRCVGCYWDAVAADEERRS